MTPSTTKPSGVKPKLQVVQSERDMAYNTDDVRIRGVKELIPPSHLMREFPVTDQASSTVYRAREEIHRIMHRGDDRLLVMSGRVRSTIMLRRWNMPHAYRRYA